MLTRLAVKGFKALADVEIELGQINVFVGANGSGKTSVLEALGLLSAAASGRVDDAALLARGVRPGVPALYKTSLKGRRIPPAIYLNATWTGPDGRVRYSVGLNNPLGKPGAPWGFATETLTVGEPPFTAVSRAYGPEGHIRAPSSLTDADRPGLPLARLDWKVEVTPEVGLAAALQYADPTSPAGEFVATAERFVAFSPQTNVLRGTAPDAAPGLPVGCNGGGLPEAAQSALDRRPLAGSPMSKALALMDWISEVEAGSQEQHLLSPSVPTKTRVLRFRDRNMATRRDVLTAYDASEGALYVLFAMVLAVHPNTPRLFAIDNFDQCLNPLLARRLSTLFCETVLATEDHRQVLLTTHSPQVLDGIDLKDDRIRLFVVDRNRDGSARVDPIRITPDLIDLAAQNGYSLSRLWLSGRLGGLPEI